MTRRRTYDVAYRGRRVGLNEGARNEARPKVGPNGGARNEARPKVGPIGRREELARARRDSNP